MNHSYFASLLLALLLLTGCTATPTPIPTPEVPLASPTVESATPTELPSTTPTSAPPTATVPPTPLPPTATPEPTATATPAAETAEDGITALVAQMENAVVERDEDLYLSYVDLSDPLFALEHTRWAEEWGAAGVFTDYTMTVADIEVAEESSATAFLTITWSTRDMGERIATLPVQFRQDASGAWKYAGEQWVTYETEQFVLLVAPGLEGFADDNLDTLPAIYDHATTSLEHIPSTRNTIKLYDSSPNLVAMTLLSLGDVTGWNEPGESLKLFNREGWVPQATIAHEFTHFLTFDMANTTHGKSPWWLMEGLAQYVAAPFWAEGEEAAYLATVVEWNANNNLVPWRAISDFNNIQTNRWRDTYPQGYSFVRYITETYGAEARNEWLRLMSADDTIETATPAVFGVTFAEADVGWKAWLASKE